MKCWTGWSKTGIKIARRNINNSRYADDSTLKAESKVELKHILMQEESEKAGLKLNIQKLKIMGWEDPLEKGMATHSSILAWIIPWTEGPGGLQSIGHEE